MGLTLSCASLLLSSPLLLYGQAYLHITSLTKIATTHAIWSPFWGIPRGSQLSLLVSPTNFVLRTKLENRGHPCYFPNLRKIPISNEALNMAPSGLHKAPAASITNSTETLSYPADLEHFNFLISFSIVLGSTGVKFETGGCGRPSINYVC